jgi:hypothetical protein
MGMKLSSAENVDAVVKIGSAKLRLDGRVVVKFNLPPADATD